METLKPTFDRLPKVSCIMPTFGRPELVSEAVWCFHSQDYQNKELVLVNDCAGQTFIGNWPNVRIINLQSKFATLGEKRNYAIDQSSGDVLFVWDDDDISLPWRLSFTITEMLRLSTAFYRPAEFLAYWGESTLHNNQSIPGWVSHGGVAFTRELWNRVGGYRHRYTG